jgi:hypothetical protein
MKLETLAIKASKRHTSSSIHFRLTMDANRRLLSCSASAEGFELPSDRTCQCVPVSEKAYSIACSIATFNHTRETRRCCNCKPQHTTEHTPPSLML